jgi:Uncharacterized membrane protein
LREEKRNTVKVACIYMTTIIGAGFASGQEIIKFFSKYYTGGFFGIILAGILFSVIGCLVLDKVYTDRIRNYDELVFPMVGWVIGWVMEIVVMLFMASVFSIMIAGMGNIFSVNFGMKFSTAVTIIAFLCMLIMLTDIKGIMNINVVVTPVMILGIILTGLYIIIFKDTTVFSMNPFFTKATNNWFFSALIYVSYNSIMSMVVMSSLLPYLKTRRVGIAGGILGGVMLCFVALIINMVLFMFYPDVTVNEIPMLGVTMRYSKALSLNYTIVLLMAMFTSALTSGFYFVERLSSTIKIKAKYLIVITCALVIPLSNFGFGNLISVLYPIFGYIGMFLLFALAIHGFRKKAQK